MKKLLAICIILLSCPQLVSADDSSPVQESVIARCTHEGVGKGYRGGELENFVAACVRARQSSGEDDPVIRAAMSGC
jgi:hypothetical protein